MQLRRGILVLAALALSCGFAFAASSSASSPHKSNCGPSSAQTLTADAVARVYTSNGSVYGCSGTSGKRSTLGKRTSCLGTERAGPVTLTGQLVAYGVQICGVDTGFAQVVVRRLSDGKRLTSAPAFTGPLGAEPFQSVDSLVLKADGAVAWIATGRSLATHSSHRQVQSEDKNSQKLLDSSGSIQLGSLRLNGSTLTWKRGGKTRSASLH